MISVVLRPHDFRRKVQLHDTGFACSSIEYNRSRKHLTLEIAIISQNETKVVKEEKFLRGHRS
jgi:hypothetical protein